VANYTGTPVCYAVYNIFDKQGLLLDLPRLEEEFNPAYKQRLFDVFVNRSDSTHRGLINGITRRLGLKIIDCMKIIPRTDIDGISLLSMPAVVFEETKCYLYSNYSTGELLATLDRWEASDNAWSLEGLAEEINDTGYFTATILDDAVDEDRSLTIFDQSSIGLVTQEDITGQGIRVILEHNNLIEGTVAVRSPTLTRKVQTQVQLVNSGDYLVNLEDGIIFSVAAPSPGSFVRYQYRDDEFIAQSSPVILHNLQSDDFKTKMFEQIAIEGGQVDGRPTAFGADVISELLSVYGTHWGR